MKKAQTARDMADVTLIRRQTEDASQETQEAKQNAEVLLIGRSTWTVKTYI